ncbi:thermonuclease family protein [Halorubrum sp. BV1]|uniref:thermonuclease family protein n=1 Tax=Halorubrum sp. BV1 TaxID=1498500 RepID=UPI000B217F43|nr:thermonuclease family protein [Halorubrum sp. BV1]
MTETLAVLGMTLLVVLAGCGGFAGPGDQPSPSTDVAEPTDSGGPETGTAWIVTVTRVIDGDTIEVVFPNGETDTVRLLGVDTPETSHGSVTPDEFEGIPDTAAGRDHLYTWGQNAAQYATETLAGETVRIETDERADRRGGFGRLLAYVYLDGENVNERLLANGYARLYDSQFTMRDTFRDAERDARDGAVGLWGFEASSGSAPASIAGLSGVAFVSPSRHLRVTSASLPRHLHVDPHGSPTSLGGLGLCYLRGNRAVFAWPDSSDV